MVQARYFPDVVLSLRNRRDSPGADDGIFARVVSGERKRQVAPEKLEKIFQIADPAFDINSAFVYNNLLS